MKKTITTAARSSAWLLWGLGAAAAAQTAASGVDPAPGQVTVWGQRWGWPDAETAYAQALRSSTAVSADDLHAAGGLRVEDLAGWVPGLQADVSSAGLSSAVKLRGFSLTRLLYNGQPDVQRLFTRDLATVERIRVIGGPDGVFHGLAAPGGVVAYEGKLPRGDASVRTARVGVDDAGVGDVMLDATGPWNAQWAYRLVAAARDGTAPPASLPQRRRTVMGALTWAYSAAGSATLEAERTHNATPYVFGTVIEGEGTPAARPRFDQLYVLPGGAPAARHMQRWALQWRHVLPSGAALAARYSHASTLRDETLLGFYALDTPQTLSGYYTRYHDDADQSAWSAWAEDHASWVGVRHHLMAGIDGLHQQFLFTGVQNIGGFSLDIQSPDFSRVDAGGLKLSRRYTHERQAERALWASDAMTISQAWRVTLGLRQTHYRVQADRSGAGLKTAAQADATAWTLGSTLALGPQWQAYASWATGFEPNRGITHAGDYLPPQHQRQIEAGARWQAAEGHAAFSAAAYRIALSQTAITDPADRNALLAAGQRWVQGMQVQAHMHAGGIEWDANANVLTMWRGMRSSASLGDDFPGVARRTAGVRAHGPLGLAGAALRWTAALQFASRAAADLGNTTYVPGHALAHVALEWPLAGGTTLSAGVRNLFDARYVEAVTATDDVYQGPRRRAWVRVQQRF